jgi:XisH protein
MPTRDLYHDTVKRALIKDGWTITHDPFKLPVGIRDSFVDLGAEKLVAAEKGARKIAVEIKSFLSPSLLQDLETALGQFTLYRAFLSRVESDRTLYLALPRSDDGRHLRRQDSRRAVGRETCAGCDFRP